jgi:hypothetical protein
MSQLSRGLGRATAGVLLVAGLATTTYATDTAKGSINYRGHATALKYAWLVTGPSDFETGKTIRRVVLSATDIGAKLQGCRTFSCTDGEVMEGATVDFTGNSRLNYWTVANGQKVQYSGTVAVDAFVARADDARHLAGRLAIDDTAAGGPQLNAEFDVTVLKEFTVAR